jgi:hypothetical protein
MADSPKGAFRIVVEFVTTVCVGGLAKALFSLWLASPTAWTIAILIGVLSGIAFYFRYAERIIDAARFQWQVGRWSGVAQVYPIAPYPGLGQSAPNYKIRDKANSALAGAATTARDLKLLMVSGWRFIGCQNDPGLLLSVLQSQRGGFSLEVLLLDPRGDIAKKRADKQGFNHDQYVEGVKAVVWTLAHLRAHGYPVKVSYYSEEPIWQMVITELEIWLLCASRNVSTGESPVYCLKRLTAHGLAFGMLSVWDRRLATATPLDLDTATEPDWKRLKNLPPKKTP